MNIITWTACNNSNFLNGARQATSILAAVRAARHYVSNELLGEGRLVIFVNGYPVRQDECSIFTRFRWVVRTDLF